MFTISVEIRFRASHQIPMPDGSIEPQHSHDWLVTAQIQGYKLNEMGILMDFHKLRSTLDDILLPFNNSLLNELECFKKNIPSTENVAKYIFEQLKPKIPDGITLKGIILQEEPGCYVNFSP